MEEPLDRSELEKLVRRDAVAIERWFVAHADAVFTFAFYRAGRNVELARDIVQDTFLAAMIRMHQYDSRRGSMSAWLASLSRNCIKKALRNKGKRRLKRLGVQLDLDAAEACRQLSSKALPDEILQNEEVAELVRLTLASLPARYAEVLRQRYYQGQSVKQIATSGNTSEVAAKVLLHRARKSFEKTFVRLTGDANVAG
jgi:RNA polymerase sigma-70 factor (ECF subfamily)